LSSGFVTCPFEECKYFQRIEYTELGFFENHLILHHDYDELIYLALEKGIIKDRSEIRSLFSVVRKIVKQFTLRGIQNE